MSLVFCNKAMNVYDFDKTIYNGDSTLDFWKHCLIRYPRIAVVLPAAVLYAVKFKAGICSREEFKEKFYSFLKLVPDVPSEVERFWDENWKKLKPYYLEQQKADDVIISASPEFLIRIACDRLGVTCIASAVNPKTGCLEGPNCRGEEKVRRFLQQYPDGEIDSFYSDSNSDRFMAKMAQQAYLVKGNKILDWRK